MTDQSATVIWRHGDLPVSPRFDDPYYSPQGGLEEARHVFLTGNGLPDRFRPGFHIAELGFGTGLNALAAWQAWRGAAIPGSLRYTAFEAYPLSADDMARALAQFPQVAPLARDLVAAWRGGARSIALPGLRLDVVIGDARRTLPNWDGCADAWFLDGFAPARNPELWEPGLLQEVANHSAPNGSLATYTAAGHVRRTLAEAGFSVERRPGFGRKRHMTVARKTPS